MVEKIPHTIFPLKCGFGIGYGIGGKYLPKLSANVSFGFGIGPKPK